VRIRPRPTQLLQGFSRIDADQAHYARPPSRHNPAQAIAAAGAAAARAIRPAFANREAIVCLAFGTVAPQATTWSLTSREFEIACLAAEGFTCREIRRRLGINRLTAESHVEAIRSKLEMKHKRDLVSLAKPRAWWGISSVVSVMLSWLSEESGSSLMRDEAGLGVACSLSMAALVLGPLLRSS
jgi:DNA-binding CsgD family transcriptional regulator